MGKLALLHVELSQAGAQGLVLLCQLLVDTSQSMVQPFEIVLLLAECLVAAFVELDISKEGVSGLAKVRV